MRRIILRVRLLCPIFCSGVHPAIPRRGRLSEIPPKTAYLGGHRMQAGTKEALPTGAPLLCFLALFVGRCSGCCSGCGRRRRGRRGRFSGGRSGLHCRLGCLVLLASGNGKNHGNCGNGYDCGDLLHVISPPFFQEFTGRAFPIRNKEDKKTPLRRNCVGSRNGGW
jgi:hypothetical protein